MVGIGIYSLLNIPIGAVPDVTNNQVQVITTSRDLSTQEVERFLTYPVELEMSNLPGVTEIRSISKFGLSVVTIVFEDEMGTYLPRQLISERLKTVSDQIPDRFGTPFMGPISTGLGEIYQYILDVEPAYADQYDVTELRSIQDWIVKRQLSGIPGVVEVNTWGGFLKTFEVGIDPEVLRAMDITITQVYNAVADNNSVTGGGYIEKSQEAYFVRAEALLTNIQEIEDIVVSNKDGIPIYVRDIASVKFGAATRFGAITGNGEGEKVLGQVMMLKGANSKEVINAVRERVAQVQESLPPGVFINPFLDRSDLIARTTNTVAENLILGFLIVLFVVVLLLGNLRSGLVVASVIPLTLLFALTLMYFTGVDANLMSLGAIDFGIIIDGAVIIVEYIAFRITQQGGQLIGLSRHDKRQLIDTIAGNSAGRMMRSAIFGQIIIMIVFIPVLSLAGIEGKMFRPMALTFCFALLGAMILCLTYVPIMSALFLRPSQNATKNISYKIITTLQSWYGKILTTALRFKWLLIVIALIAMVGTGIIFSKMGGEFVPTLDEGDFVIQPVLKTGMSLAETVTMTTRMERIIGRFPEVKQVVSRIGAAEVPTDPMSLEESDVIITLTDKATWTSANSKDDLAEVFKEAILAEIPGIEIEFTQPIEMRFNELITGARADLAIKLYGEDLEILYKKAQEIQFAIQGVEGAADITVEKIDGLPQMSVTYKKDQLSRYGVTVEQLNEIISIGIGGRVAGSIYEGERQFDVVVRYAKNARDDINDIRNAVVDLPNGDKVPLHQLADVNITSGPAKISRDNTKRHVVIGVNVRGRDISSVVEEVQAEINDKIRMPAGYYLDYGGQFENLQMATERLLVAVPIALILIFILLYFAFGSFIEAVLIYSAIPLAAIGGVLSLYLRDMPFSISAGVGFIALFGIAVLNGIVMIEHFKELIQDGMKDINERIVIGATDRLRPVLLTAIAAALGFLPMAISSSAGAEVQRPLATVVIGGLISATLLTLIILPILYSIYVRMKKRNPPTTVLSCAFALLLLPTLGSSQKVLTLDELIDKGMNANQLLRSSDLEVSMQSLLIDATKEVDKTSFYYQYDHNNIPEVGGPLHVLGASHSWLSPAVHKSRRALQESVLTVAERQKQIEAFYFEGQIRKKYDEFQYYATMTDVLMEINNLYISLHDKAAQKTALGEGNVINELTIKHDMDATTMRLKESRWNSENALQLLKKIIRSSEDIRVEKQEYEMLEAGTDIVHPIVDYQEALYNKALHEQATDDTDQLPEWNLSAFTGFNSFSNASLYPGVQVGVAIPISKKPYEAKHQANEIKAQITDLKRQNTISMLASDRERLTNKLSDLHERILDHEQRLMPTVSALLTSAEKALQFGEMDYFQYLLIIEKSHQARISQLDLIHDYNQTTISLQYILN